MGSLLTETKGAAAVALLSSVNGKQTQDFTLQSYVSAIAVSPSGLRIEVCAGADVLAIDLRSGLKVNRDGAYEAV
jgi:hypothetical protein